jgi:Pyrimidine dimer DNA glycosylase
MRLWTVHPRYLDPPGLVALWREALLARAVLRGETRGYRSHPQLSRFQEQAEPVGAVNRYLAAVYHEALRRGCHFDRRKLGRATSHRRIAETTGQLAFERAHLLRRLQQRHPRRYEELRAVNRPKPPRARCATQVRAGPV